MRRNVFSAYWELENVNFVVIRVLCGVRAGFHWSLAYFFNFHICDLFIIFMISLCWQRLLFSFSCFLGIMMISQKKMRRG